jgi:hypothetical protein
MAVKAYVEASGETGLFWTRPYERMGLAKELGDAEEAVASRSPALFLSGTEY